MQYKHIWILLYTLLMMALNDPIYISSDEEEEGSKRSRPKRHHILGDRASKLSCRAKSFDLPTAKDTKLAKRSNSVPAVYTVLSIPITRSVTPRVRPRRSQISAARSDDFAKSSLLNISADIELEGFPAADPPKVSGVSATPLGPKDSTDMDDGMVGGGDVPQ